MVKFILTIFLLCFACGKNEPNKYDHTLESIRVKKNFYISEVTDIRSHVERYDGLTFLGLWDAYGGTYDIYDHEYAPGEWHRDRDPCYPDDSRSEISTEGILGALHAMIERGDYDKIQDVWNYMDANDWIAGEGPEEYTNVRQLKPLIKEMLGEYKLSEADEEATIGYRGNVLADYIALHMISLGYIPKWQLESVRFLVDAHPASPIYQALAGCFIDREHYDTAINILGGEDHFPTDRLPDKVLEGIFDWSDSPSVVGFAFSVAILSYCNMGVLENGS